eukprot:TRINITY_DN14912_c0_g2_i3.p1 TRINITY_DN14912_c0_g2~~TRINITY_DN14912_c0_g2_i3.p1  ORF type:complete len:106 (-),score=6.99 TRINITY_DN14912_c0_g2_i3:485-802(-)
MCMSCMISTGSPMAKLVFSHLLDRIESFKANEESFADTGVEESRIVILSDDFLLVFEPEQKQTPAADYAVLNCCIRLSSIKMLERKPRAPELMAISWESKEVPLP